MNNVAIVQDKPCRKRRKTVFTREEWKDQITKRLESPFQCTLPQHLHAAVYIYSRSGYQALLSMHRGEEIDGCSTC